MKEIKVFISDTKVGSYEEYHKENGIPWEEYKKELLENHNIVYKEESTHPIKIVERKVGNPLLIIGVDEGEKLSFEIFPDYDIELRYKNGFDYSWTDSLIDNLLEAKYIARNKRK